MIRVLVYDGEEPGAPQLAELKITRLEQSFPGSGLYDYTAEIAVDNGEDLCIFNEQFSHNRESGNVLGLISNLLDTISWERLRLGHKEIGQ